MLIYSHAGYCAVEYTWPLTSAAIVVLSYALTYLLTPVVMRRMRRAGKMGVDVNKKDKRKIPEMGGIASMLSFSGICFLTAGLMRVLDTYEEYSIHLTIAALVFVLAAVIGFVDDLGLIRRREKAVLIAVASIPLVIFHPVDAVVTLPFAGALDLGQDYMLFLAFWFLGVPFGVMACANAFNMSAGYNGMESGIPAITSASMLAVLFIKGAGFGSVLIYSTLMGSALGLFYYNRYPARVFVGDIGTLGFGAVYASAAVLADVIPYAIIAIAPAFFELYDLAANRKVPLAERRRAALNPVILRSGRLKPPKGAETYNLGYYLLSRRPMREPELVSRIFLLYGISGLAAVLLCILAAFL